MIRLRLPRAAAARSCLDLPVPRLDLEAALAELAASQPIPLNWRHSARDLLTLLQLNPSLPARRALARELGYGGPLIGWDSVDPMDQWLHAEIVELLLNSHGIIPIGPV